MRSPGWLPKIMEPSMIYRLRPSLRIGWTLQPFLKDKLFFDVFWNIRIIALECNIALDSTNKKHKIGKDFLTKCLRKVCFFCSLCHLGSTGHLSHLVYCKTSVKTCLIGCYPEFRIASKLGRTASAVEIKKKWKTAGWEDVSLRGMGGGEDTSCQRVVITSEMVTRFPVLKCHKSN